MTSGCGHASIPSGRSVKASSGWCFHPQWAHWEAPSRLCSSSASLCNVAIFLLYLLPWEPYSSCQSRPCCCKRSSKPLLNLDAFTTPLASVGTNTGSIIKTLRFVCSQRILKTQKTPECASWKSNKETFSVSYENTTANRDSLCIQYNEVAHSGIVFPFAKGNLKVWWKCPQGFLHKQGVVHDVLEWVLRWYSIHINPEFRKSNFRKSATVVCGDAVTPRIGSQWQLDQVSSFQSFQKYTTR